MSWDKLPGGFDEDVETGDRIVTSRTTYYANAAKGERMSRAVLVEQLGSTYWIAEWRTFSGDWGQELSHIRPDKKFDTLTDAIQEAEAISDKDISRKLD